MTTSIFIEEFEEKNLLQRDKPVSVGAENSSKSLLFKQNWANSEKAKRGNNRETSSCTKYLNSEFN